MTTRCLGSASRLGFWICGHSCLFRISKFGFGAFLWPLLAVLMGGCVSAPQRLPVCPGKATVEEALQTLAAHAATAVPLRANGRGHADVPRAGQEEPRATQSASGAAIRAAGGYLRPGQRQPERAGCGHGLEPASSSGWPCRRRRSAATTLAMGRGARFRGAGDRMSPRVVLEAFGILAEPNSEPEPLLDAGEQGTVRYPHPAGRDRADAQTRTRLCVRLPRLQDRVLRPPRQGRRGRASWEITRRWWKDSRCRPRSVSSPRPRTGGRTPWRSISEA